MDKAWWDRWAPVTGLIFLVLFLVGYLMLGEPPEVTDPAQEFADSFQEDRGRILAGSVVLGVSILFLVLFVAALAARVRDAGEPRPAAAIVAGGAAAAAIALIVLGMLAALAHTVAEEADPDVVKALGMLVIGIDTMSAIALAVLILAFGVAVLRSGVLASWFGHVSIVAALLVALGATTWAREGFWGLYGGYVWVVVAVFVLWVAAASVLLLARPPASRTSGTGPPPSA